jgi:hypothetical protein
MFGLLAIFYLLILIFFIVAGLFVVYHIVKYSFSSKSTFVTLVLFLSVFSVLLLTNMILFMKIDVASLVSDNVIFN